MKQSSGSTSTSPTSPRNFKRRSRRDRLCPYGDGIYDSPLNMSSNSPQFMGICEPRSERPDTLSLSSGKRRSNNGLGQRRLGGNRIGGGLEIVTDSVHELSFPTITSDKNITSMMSDELFRLSDESPTPLFSNARRRHSSTSNGNKYRRRTFRLPSDCSSDSAFGDETSSSSQSPATSLSETPDLAKDFLFLAMDSPLEEDMQFSSLSRRTHSLPSVSKLASPQGWEFNALAGKHVMEPCWELKRPGRSPLSSRVESSLDEDEDCSSCRKPCLVEPEKPVSYQRSSSVPSRSCVRIRLFGNSGNKDLAVSTRSPAGQEPAQEPGCLSLSSSVTDIGDSTLVADGSPSNPLLLGRLDGSPESMCQAYSSPDLCAPKRRPLLQGSSPLPGLSSLLSAPLLSAPRSTMECPPEPRKTFTSQLSLPTTFEPLRSVSLFEGGGGSAEGARSTPMPPSDTSSSPIDMDTTPRHHTVRLSSYPGAKGIPSIFHTASLSTNAFLSDGDSDVEGSNNAFYSLPSTFDGNASSPDEDNELTRAGRFDVTETPNSCGSLKRCRPHSPESHATQKTPKDIEGKRRHCCLNDPPSALSPFTLKTQNRVLSSTSSPQINAAYGILSPGQKAASLIGDFSRPHSLPAFSTGANTGVHRISWQTLQATLNGDHSLPGKFLVIDCRYPYEYNGGHIEGAINIDTAQDITDRLMSCAAIQEVEKCGREGRPIIPVFHCEFSVKRSVALFQHLRKKDRELHLENYPKLCYPEMYLLSGGYKEFYDNCKPLCNPPHYVSMNDKKFSGELTRFSRSKTYSGLRSEIPRFRHRNSLKF